MSEQSKKLYPTRKRQKNPDTPAFVGKYYLTNATLLPEVLVAKEQNKVTEKLGQMFLTLTTNYAKRPIFSSYTYKNDMISEALINLCQNALKFDPEKSNNPFSFYTTCIHNSFLQYLNTEKKHRRIRDQLLIDIGENPSFNFTSEYTNHVKEDNELKQNMVELRQSIVEAKERETKEIIKEEKAKQLLLDFQDSVDMNIDLESNSDSGSDKLLTY